MLITRITDRLVVVCLTVSTKIISQLMLGKGDIFQGGTVTKYPIRGLNEIIELES